MALSRKQLKELKSKMAKSNPKAFNAARNASKQTKSITNKKVFKEANFSSKKSVVRYAFKPNELVEINYLGEKIVGLIVSDFEYFSRKVEKNCFFVLYRGSVKQLDGRYIRKI